MSDFDIEYLPLPPLPEPWQGFQYNSGWKSWEQVVRSAINDPHVTRTYTADQVEQIRREAIAADRRKQAALTQMIELGQEIEASGEPAKMIRDLVALWDSEHVSQDDYNEAMCAIEDRMRAYVVAPSHQSPGKGSVNG